MAVRLPDGRDVMADYRHPVVGVMRQVLGRRMMMGLNAAEEASAADYAVIARWLDAHPDEACSARHCAMHGPPGDEPPGFRPPPYREGAR